MEYYFLLFAGLALLGAIYTSRSGFAALKRANIDTRAARWLTAMSVLLALPVAVAAVLLHFIVPHFYGPYDLATPIFCLTGLGSPLVIFMGIHAGLKRIPRFRLYPIRFWTYSAASGMLLSWSAWTLLSYRLFTTS